MVVFFPEVFYFWGFFPGFNVFGSLPYESAAISDNTLAS